MSTQWLYKSGQHISGPLASETLRELVEQGQILPTTLVQRVGSQKWVEARRINGLFAAASDKSTRVSHTKAASIDSSSALAVSAANDETAKPAENSLVTWTKRGASEVAISCTLMLTHLKSLIRYATGLWNLRSLRNRAFQAKLTLGQNIYESGQGDAELRTEIGKLGNRIQNIERGKGSTTQLAAERRGLFIRLADVSSNLSGEAPTEQERASVTATEMLQQRETYTADQRSHLFPVTMNDRLRLAMMYLVTIVCGVFVVPKIWTGQAEQQSVAIVDLEPAITAGGLNLDAAKQKVANDAGVADRGEKFSQEIDRTLAFTHDANQHLERKIKTARKERGNDAEADRPPTEADMRQAFENTLLGVNSNLKANKRMVETRSYDKKDPMAALDALGGVIAGDAQIRLVKFKKISATKSIGRAGYNCDFIANVTVDGNGFFAESQRGVFRRSWNRPTNGRFYKFEETWIFAPNEQQR